MAGNVQQDVIDTVLDDEDATTEPVADNDDDEAPYLPAKGMSIPVPKTLGTLIERKYKDAKEAYEPDHQKWDQAFEMYRQSSSEGVKLDDGETYRNKHEADADENIIRVNIRSVMRSTYMQNPHVEFTDTQSGKLADSIGYIFGFLMSKRSYPGIGMKAKARRWVLHAQLTNFGVIRLDYQPHEGSQDEAIAELQKLEKSLEKAKTKKDVKEIYARLERLHEQMPLTDRKGMKLTNVLPNKVIVDPKCTYPDLSDADWLAEEFDMDRIYMQQTYYEEDEDGVLRLRANPKATTRPVGESSADDIKEKVVDTVINARTDEQNEVLKKQTVACIYFYDKILRRRYLFNTEDWSYPLWVEDDDLQLSRFFRHFILSFGEPVDGVVQAGEVSYYIGQAKQINEINRKVHQIRQAVFNTLVYNKKNTDSKEVTRLVRHLNNPGRVRAFGIGDDGDRKISEILEALQPPSMQHRELFDTTNLRQQIGRMASTSEVDQGQQFKTNTTNDQVNYYQNNRQETTGIMIDIVEDALDDLAWSMTEVLVSKYSPEEITEMVGPKKAEGFQTMSVEDFNKAYRMQIASGSIEKPSSEFKKRESLNIAQAIGQVGQAAPGTTMMIMLRMFQNAFSNLIVTEDDWSRFNQEIQANMQKGVSTNAPPAK